MQTQKPLAYIHSFQGSLNTSITLNKISISGLIYHCGERPFNIDKYMNSFTRFDLNISYILPNFNNNLKQDFANNNIFNDDIRSLPDYSEPGRYCSISINYNPTNLFSAL